MQPHSCKCSPKQCFTGAYRTGNSSHCGLYLDRNLSGDITRHGNLGSGPNISWTTCHSADYCGQSSLCTVAHSFGEVVLAVILPIPSLTKQLDVKEKGNMLYFTVSLSSRKVLCWCCMYILVFISNAWPYLIPSVNVGTPSLNSSLDHE